MKVSVVIPAYNNEDTIAASVESALAQRFDGGFEVIVVNDGSTDGTRAALAKFGDRIRVIDQANAGVASARNAGIAAAIGEYIALLDGDDSWTEDKLTGSVELLDRNPAAVATFSDLMEVDGAGREVSHYVPPEFARPPTLDEMLERPWPFLPSAIVIRRETLAAIGGFAEDFEADHYGGEDTFLMLLVRERGEILYVPGTPVRRRLREPREHYAPRLGPRRVDAGWQEFSELERRFGGAETLARLTREHFGARGRKFSAWVIDRIGDELVTVGLMAMHDGNRALAIRCYRASLGYNPWRLKTYLRLAWAMLPAAISARICPLLAPGLRRSLAGPPFTALQDRAN